MSSRSNGTSFPAPVEVKGGVSIDVSVAVEPSSQGEAPSSAVGRGNLPVNLAAVNSDQGKTIRHLCEVRGDFSYKTFFSVTEEELESLGRKYQDSVHSKEKQAVSAKTEIYQLIGFVAAFQGLIVGPILQGSMLNCKTKWWAIVFTLFASFATGVVVVMRVRRVATLHEKIKRVKPLAKACNKMRARLRKHGPEKFRFEPGDINFTESYSPQEGACGWKWSISGLFVIVGYTIFSLYIAFFIDFLVCVEPKY